MRPPPTAKAPSPSHNAWALRAPARVPLYPGDLDLRPYLSIEVARSYRFKRGSGLPVRVPVIEMVEIGAGGGSIAGADDLERIHVGPESAGSEPGPAAYGRVGRAGSHAGRGGAAREGPRGGAAGTSDRDGDAGGRGTRAAVRARTFCTGMCYRGGGGA